MRTPLGRAALGILAFGVATCTFERRPDRAPDSDPGNGTRAAAAADSVIAVVAAFHEALERGDLARAADYLHVDAEVYDRSIGPMGLPALDALDHTALWSAGSAPGLTSATPTLLGETALVVAEFAAAAPESDGSGASFETLILVRGAGGWTIRHLHRSDGPDS